MIINNSLQCFDFSLHLKISIPIKTILSSVNEKLIKPNQSINSEDNDSILTSPIKPTPPPKTINKDGYEIINDKNISLNLNKLILLDSSHLLCGLDVLNILYRMGN